MVTHRGRNTQPKIFCLGSGHVTPMAKNTGGGRPPKRPFLGLGLGSRLAASLRSPDALAHAPTTPHTRPASQDSVKDRDSAVVTEPDGRQIDASFICGPAAATEQPARLSHPLLPPTTPWCRIGSPALAPHGHPTTRAAACRRLPCPRRRARHRKRREPCTGTGVKKKKIHGWPPTDHARPPAG